MKLISIIMATYNRERFIVETLKSIQAQSYQNFECIIVDDGGSDNTLELITPILYSDSRFTFQKRTDNYKKGLPGTRNYGLDLAKGDYIIFFDDDDIVHPQNLELCVVELSKHNVSFCRYIRGFFKDTFDYNFNYSKEYDSFFIYKKDVFSLINQKLPFNSCSVMWKKECFDENRYTEDLLHAEEWELYSRILSTGIIGISIEKTLYYARQHNHSMTGQYFRSDPKRTKSNVDAILLVIKNLKKKELITNTVIRHFVTISLDYKVYDLFSQIIKILNLSLLEKIKWQIYYSSYFLRLPIYKMKKNIKK